MRLRGDYLAIVTLGFGEITQDLLRNLEAITKGTQGINPLKGPIIGPFEVSSVTPIRWYYLILLILALAAFMLQRLLHSPTGRSWLALRDDELAASCMGINPARTKLSTFALSAGLCAIAGALLASFLGSSGEPSNYDFQVSIMALSMVIVGGLGSIPGAILGALIMVGINSILLAKIADWLSNVTAQSSNVLASPANWKYMIFGFALVLMMRWRSEGLMPARRESTPGGQT
jgi:branched-chain amino acid transport system permease protein